MLLQKRLYWLDIGRLVEQRNDIRYRFRLRGGFGYILEQYMIFSVSAAKIAPCWTLRIERINILQPVQMRICLTHTLRDDVERILSVAGIAIGHAVKRVFPRINQLHELFFVDI